MASEQPFTAEMQPRLKRLLSRRDLIFYGIILITPIAPVPIYGLGQQLSDGHLVLCLLLAGIAMMFTAASYAKMANRYPSAGSAYVYTGRGLGPLLGFVAGWAMILDYLILPIVAVVQAALAAHRLIPQIGYEWWIGAFVLLITGLNLRGIKTAARVGSLLLLAMFAVIGTFIVLAVRYVAFEYGAGAFTLGPIYDAQSFDLIAIATATSFAALTFIGFDGITAMAEDAREPKRDLPIALIGICLFTTVFSCLLVYLAQLVWPDHDTFLNIETAFMDVSRQVGGDVLFHALGVVVILSSFGAALAGQAAAARVPFAMGRDSILPRIFARLSGRQIPATNIMIVAGLTWLGSAVLNLEQAGVLLNFGAFLAFMGVNLAAFRETYLKTAPGSHRRAVRDGLVPLLGFLFCFCIWISLPVAAKAIGGAWLTGGLIYYWLRMRSLPAKS